MSSIVLEQVGSALALPWVAARYRRDQWLPAERIAQLRERRLARLLRRAAAAPYYRELFERAGLRLDRPLGSAELARLPLLGRTAMETAGLDAFLTVDRRRLFTIFTSGSTSRPGMFLRSAFEEASFSARWARVYAAYGCGTFDSQVNIASGGAQKKLGAVNLLRAVRLLPRVVNLKSAAPIAETAEHIRRLKPRILVGYSAAIETLADYVITNRIPFPRPRLVICAAMEVTEHCRNLAARAFGAPVANVYVTNELGVVGWSCPHRPDVLHMNDDSFVIEILGADGRPAPPGTVGEIVATPLFLHSMPLIRYRIGDLAARLDGRCECGRGLGLMSPVQGRTAHALVGAGGQLVTAPLLAAAFGQSGSYTWVKRFQLREEIDGCVRVLVEQRREPTAAEREALLSALRQLIEPTFVVRLEPTDSIPLAPSGKFQWIVPLAGSRGATRAA